MLELHVANSQIQRALDIFIIAQRGEFGKRTLFISTFRRFLCLIAIHSCARNKGPFVIWPPRLSKIRRAYQHDCTKSPVAANWTVLPPAVIHFSTHTRKVKMAALTVSFAGKIGATAPRVANARAAGESPDVPPPPRPSAPFPRSSEILSSSRTAICVLRASLRLNPPRSRRRRPWRGH